MTLLPFTDCCLLLGVDPKTLRLWLTSAHLSCCPHPTDARLKCLTLPQLRQLATLHDRFLPDPLPGEANHPGSSPVTQASKSPDRPAPHEAALPPEADLRHQIFLLQMHVASLQEHVTQLALALVQQQQLHWERAVASPSPSLPSPVVPSTPLPKTPRHRPVAAKPASPANRDQPRSRALPLIEQGADGQWVVISPTQGVLPFTPDSPAWFAWLSSLTAFTFQSQQGHFSATRKFRNGQRIQSWNVHRSLHGRSCTLYLGLTSTLTLARLQEIAATIHARLTTL